MTWLPYQKDLICTFAQCGVIRTVNRSLAGELWIKLAHIVSRLLSKLDIGLSNSYILNWTIRWRNTPQKSDCSYQERLEWWFYFTCEKVIPINVSEEGMSLEHKFKLIKSQTKAQHLFLKSEVRLNIKTTRKSIVKDHLHSIKPFFIWYTGF